MKLALRKTAPTNATWLQRLACWAIKARLVSQYCHGGIVINGELFHATAAHGLHSLPAGQWSPDNWDLIELGDAHWHHSALKLFAHYQGARYDWVSLLAFVGLRVRDHDRMYCFEWCWLAMTGQVATERVTPEMLLTLRTS